MGRGGAGLGKRKQSAIMSWTDARRSSWPCPPISESSSRRARQFSSSSRSRPSSRTARLSPDWPSSEGPLRLRSSAARALRRFANRYESMARSHFHFFDVVEAIALISAATKDASQVPIADRVSHQAPKFVGETPRAKMYQQLPSMYNVSPSKLTVQPHAIDSRRVRTATSFINATFVGCIVDWFALE